MPSPTLREEGGSQQRAASRDSEVSDRWDSAVCCHMEWSKSLSENGTYEAAPDFFEAGIILKNGEISFHQDSLGAVSVERRAALRCIRDVSAQGNDRDSKR